MKPLVSVIITTKNEEKYLEPCLKSIRDQDYPNVEIIVSDACSSDDTVEVAKKYADKIVVKKTNISEGRNLGAEYARGEYFVFLDADTILEQSWIDNALKKLSSENVAAVIGQFSFLEKNSRTKIYGCLWKLLLTVCRGIGIPHPPGLGCTLAVKRSKFFDVNGFRDVLSTTEDMDFLRRIRRVGSVVMEKNCRALTSARRVEKEGYVKWSILWVLNGIWYLLTSKPLLKNYESIR